MKKFGKHITFMYNESDYVEEIHEEKIYIDSCGVSYTDLQHYKNIYINLLKKNTNLFKITFNIQTTMKDKFFLEDERQTNP